MNNEDLRNKLKTSEFKNITLERCLIAGLISNSDIINKAIEQLDSLYFSSNRIKWIYENIISFYDENNVLPDKETFDIILSKKPIKERKALSRIWGKILTIKCSKSKTLAIIKELGSLYRARLLQNTIGNSLLSLKKAVSGGSAYIDEAVKKISSVSDMLATKNKNVTLVDPLSTFGRFKKEHLEIQVNPDKYLGIMTGIEKLDQRMGGLRPSELGLITTSTGRGKSILLMDFAYNCFLSQGDVLFVTIEMPWKQLRERLFCRMLGIHYDYFRFYKLNRKHFARMERKIKKFEKDHENRFWILDIPQSCTVRYLQNEIEKFVEKNKKPREICIDYMNIIQGGLDWQKQLEIAIDLKQKIARYFEVATWTANQVGGAKAEKEHIKIPDMAYAKNIADNVDVGISIGQTEMSEDEEIFNLDFLKTRDFSAKGFQIQADRARMTFISVKGKAKARSFKEIGKKPKVKT